MAPTVRSLLVAVAGASAIAIAFACSSVPDVQFVDGGETTSASSSGTSGEPSPEAQAPPPEWACPDKPPPEGSGVCCGGGVLCLKCSASDCPRCEQEGCPGTVSAACCPKNPVQMECKSYSQCL